MKKTEYTTFSFDEHAKKCDVDDFLKQMLRTVKGEPIEQEQISLIIEVISGSLSIDQSDALLDLACGNGSLASLLFNECSSYKGIDISAYLIEIARSNFQISDSIAFEASPADVYVKNESQPERFTKVNCFGSLQYLTNEEVSIVLCNLFTRFSNVEKVFLGNMPDKNSYLSFYKDREPTETELNDNNTAIGKWRTKSELGRLANEAGWQVEFTAMPADFYAKHYRFNAVLTR
ncbi:methyltransferase domain-containing protein [Alteromonas australica]|uniref:Methyltransferase domain-containing protein n=1 Tax=Alteromonas australica TaxID=589873 RepID=A0A075NTZ5_9ALTE|nr:methyltransferase domain-containing protein [Alteromonas australica]AIF98139.1 hypothetical protein EP13_05160 [Alteromonas australica]